MIQQINLILYVKIKYKNTIYTLYNNKERTTILYKNI